MSSIRIGAVYAVRWYSGIGDNELYISRDGGSTTTLLTTIAGGEPEDIFEYLWTATGPLSDDCQFIVKDLYDNEETVILAFSIINAKLWDSLRHLLPRGKAWALTIDKRLRQFFLGLGNGLAGARNFFDLVFLDIFPDTTRQLTEWEKQFGIIYNGSTTEDARRTQLDTAWKLNKINTAEQVQEALDNAGFSVYVHEWWVPGTEPAIGVHAAATVRSPFVALYGHDLGCGEALAQCGEASAQCGGSTYSSFGYVLVNKITSLSPNVIPGCGEALTECGEATALCGNYITFLEIPKEYTIPNNPAYWPYFIYIGGLTFPDFATVDSDRREELENLLLKICPAQQWLGMLINYS